MLTIAVGSVHKGAVVGSVDIDDFTSLAQLRELVERELDARDIPADFRFKYRGAPCALRQEPQAGVPVLADLRAPQVAKAQRNRALARGCAHIRRLRGRVLAR